LKEEWVIHAESLELGEIIGKGAFGVVHKALLLGSTEVALKVSHHKSKLVETHMRALLNEVRVLRRIRHPNIVLFSGATVLWRNSEPVFCMVLEWIDGGDLRQYASRRRRDGSFDRACQQQMKNSRLFMDEYIILIDITRGMQYLHGQSPPILHRDLKPGNILIELSEPPKGKIADFGLSVLVQEDIQVVAGTRQYMAPEISKKKLYGTPADVFSFGCVCLYIMLGKSPNPDSALHDCEANRDLVPFQLVEVAMKCLPSEPEMRIDFHAAYTMLR